MCGVKASMVAILVSYAPALNPVLSISLHPCHDAVNDGIQ
jgi:hypothetical protein